MGPLNNCTGRSGGSCERSTQRSSSTHRQYRAVFRDSVHRDKLYSQLVWAVLDTATACSTSNYHGASQALSTWTPAYTRCDTTPPGSSSRYDDSFLTSVVTASSICLSFRPGVQCQLVLSRALCSPLAL